MHPRTGDVRGHSEDHNFPMKELPHKAAPLRLSVARRVYRLSGGSSFNLCQGTAMSPRRRKAEDADVFAAMVRVMLRVGPAELTLSAIAAEAGATAGVLVQRFGSKRRLLHAHARYGASTGDIGFGAPRTARTSSPLRALRAVTALHAKLAESPRAAVRNLAYLQNDLADPVLRRHCCWARRSGSLRTAAGRRRRCGRTAPCYRRPGAGTDDRGHACWFVPGLDTVSRGSRGHASAQGSRRDAPAVPEAWRRAGQVMT